MLQRIQSLFLFLAAALNIGLLFSPIWKYTQGQSAETIEGMRIASILSEGGNTATIPFMDNPIHIVAFVLTILVSLFVLFIIFQYANRVKQIKLLHFAVLLLAVQILSWVYLSMQGPYSSVTSADGGIAEWGFALPMLAMAGLLLARRFIQKDEKMVRAVDRIR